MIDANAVVAYIQANWMQLSAGGGAGFAAGFAAANPVGVALAAFQIALKWVPGFRASIRKNPTYAKAIVDQIETELDKVIDQEAAADAPLPPPPPKP